MPKKFSGGNSKAEAAKERKDVAKQEAASKAAKAKDDSYWAEAEGKKSKAQLKKEEEAKKRDEAAARKAESKRLAEEEDAALSKPKTTPKGAGPSKGASSATKVTAHELALQKEADRERMLREAEKRKAAAKRLVDEEDYAKMVEVENRNRMQGEVDLRSVDAALSELTVDADPDKHPERRMRAAWNAYYEAQLPVLKQEMPGLKLNQYKDKIWKLWQKSPENPMNQARLAAAQQQDG